jgi:hypothetical protein
MDKRSNVMKNKIYQKIAYALPKHQFGGQMLDYFKGLIPKLNRYQGFTSQDSNLYSKEAQDYYRDLLNKNELTRQGKVLFPGYQTPTFIDPNDPWVAQPSDPNLNQTQRGGTGTNTPKTPGGTYESRKNYNGTTDVNGTPQAFQEQYQKDISKQYSDRITETGVNIFSLMQGQEAYDNKPKDNLTVRNTGHTGFRYGQFGGVVNLTGYTPGTSSYNNPFNIIPGSNITSKPMPNNLNISVQPIYKEGLGKPFLYNNAMPDINDNKAIGFLEKKLPYYKNGGIVEGDYDIDDMSQLSKAEFKKLSDMGYKIEFI